jgi:hypothetical protein
VKLTPEQIDHARKLIDKGEPRQYVADILSVGRSDALSRVGGDRVAKRIIYPTEVNA